MSTCICRPSVFKIDDEYEHIVLHVVCIRAYVVHYIPESEYLHVYVLDILKLKSRQFQSIFSVKLRVFIYYFYYLSNFFYQWMRSFFYGTWTDSDRAGRSPSTLRYLHSLFFSSKLIIIYYYAI